MGMSNIIEHDGKKYNWDSLEVQRLIDWKIYEAWNLPVKSILDDLTIYTADPYHQMDIKDLTLFRAIHAMLDLNVKINRKLRILLKSEKS